MSEAAPSRQEQFSGTKEVTEQHRIDEVRLAQWLEGQDWLVGDALTLADIAVAAQVECIVGAAEGQAAMAKTPAVAAWLARVDRATQ